MSLGLVDRTVQELNSYWNPPSTGQLVLQKNSTAVLVCYETPKLQVCKTSHIE